LKPGLNKVTRSFKSALKKIVKRRNCMGKLSSLLWGAAIGAGLMYFYDPQNGNRRKAMIRDQVTRLQNRGDEALDVAVSDLRNRVKGLMAEGMAMVSEGNVPDSVLEGRIHSRLGYFTRHPGAIQVSVENGKARLKGDVLANEVDSVVRGLEHVRGIGSVENNLRVHQEAGNIPQLQGEGWLPGKDGNWSPSTRLLVSVGAGYLLLYSMVRGGLIGFFARVSGLALGTRALTNLNVGQMTGMTQSADTIQLRKGIRIHAPVNEVYGLWSNFENFSRFMSNIESIRNLGNNRSHWVVKGPAGSKVEFDAIETEDIPNELIAWETTPDSQVKHHGQVRFHSSGQDSTQVNVNMSYSPPAGVAGAAVAALFGKDPKSEMDADLARMKSLLEEGKTTAGKKVKREDVMPVTGRGGRPNETHAEHKRENRPTNSSGIREGESSENTRGMGGDTGEEMTGNDLTNLADLNDMGGEGPAGPMIPPGE
jgi:uncharacterized membrane protein